jgi:hypothetical protein
MLVQKRGGQEKQQQYLSIYSRKDFIIFDPNPATNKISIEKRQQILDRLPKHDVLELDYFITYSFIQHRSAPNQFFLIHFYRFTADALAEAIIEFTALISDDI